MIANSAGNRSVSLLDDPLIVVVTPGGEPKEWSFPETLAHLLTAEDPVRSYPGLTAEQASHWHRFQVRCGAKTSRMLSVRPDELVGGDVESLAADLRAALAEAAGGPEAWWLWNKDLSTPAFLQAPAPQGEAPDEAGYRPKPIAHLTALIGSKEFERKSEAIRKMTAIEAAYSLVEFQDGVIFGGRGNYETQLTPSRAGKGSGVPFMGVRFPDASGRTFRHDVGVLLDRWERIREVNGLRGDVWALWTLPWDGQSSMPAADLEPGFIPMARLIRLRAPDASGRFSTLLFRPSEASRVADHTGGAMLGDPFTPTVPNPKEAGQFKVRGVMESGFNYPEVAELLGLGDKGGSPSPSVQAFFEQADSEKLGGVEVVFDGVAFEQGKTLGFYRRELPLPIDRTLALLFATPDPLRWVHRRMLDMVRRAKTTLRSASRIILYGEPRPGNRGDAAVEQAATLVDGFAEDSDHYFRFLFEAGPRHADGDAGWELEWAGQLAVWAREAFETVLPRLPAPGAQRLEREMNARDYLDWKLRELGAEASEQSE